MTVIVRKVSERLKKARENAKLHRDYLIQANKRRGEI